MALMDRKAITFDVVGTLIDFETGILDYVQGKARAAGLNLTDQAILEAYAVAEDHQHELTPRLPFPSMMTPMYREMAEVLERMVRRCAETLLALMRRPASRVCDIRSAGDRSLPGRW